LKTLVDFAAPRERYQRLVRDWKEEAFGEPRPDPVELLRADPARIFEPLDMRADPWQISALRSEATKKLFLCNRQSGKSRCMAAMALEEALFHPWSKILIISASFRQSVDTLDMVKEFWYGMVGEKVQKSQSLKLKQLGGEAWNDQEAVRAMGWDGAALQMSEDVVKDARDLKTEHEFPNGSKIISLPCSSKTTVGKSSISMMIIDEAARVPDEFYKALSPMRAASLRTHGREPKLVVASTPFGKRGWFWELWDKSVKARAAGRKPLFEVWEVTADQCAWLSKEFLQDERDSIGDLWFFQEYFCKWLDTANALFNFEHVEAMKVGGSGRVLQVEGVDW
jgi:hypothetical protein